jgi:lipopolysaccharide/colanic/teichoic acid biosynthesis glycosyltransferase
MIKRAFDIGFSLLALIVLFPLMVVFGLAVALGSPGGMFFRQERVGLNGRRFKLIKFRTMRPDSEAKGQITVGGNDPRITKVGLFLRRIKMDELPQLINILLGDMSVVGPRPEVPRYVAMYTAEQRKVLTVRPGLTGAASIAYINENEILGASADPERAYIEKVMPHKLDLDLRYVAERSFGLDLRIILGTVGRIVKG